MRIFAFLIISLFCSHASASQEQFSDGCFSGTYLEGDVRLSQPIFDNVSNVLDTWPYDAGPLFLEVSNEAQPDSDPIIEKSSPATASLVKAVREVPEPHVMTVQGIEPSGLTLGKDPRQHIAYWIHFQLGDYHYRLGDRDGSASILVFYCLHASYIHKQMIGYKGRADPVKQWDRNAAKGIPFPKDAIDYLTSFVSTYELCHQHFRPDRVPLLKAALGTLIKAHNRKGERVSIRLPSQKSLSALNGINFKFIYSVLRLRLVKELPFMRDFPIQVTNHKTGQQRDLNGLEQIVSDDKSWFALGNTLAYFANLTVFENAMPANAGSCLLEADLKTLYTLSRLKSNPVSHQYRQTVHTRSLPDGTIEQVVRYIPVKSEEKKQAEADSQKNGVHISNVSRGPDRNWQKK